MRETNKVWQNLYTYPPDSFSMLNCSGIYYISDYVSISKGWRFSQRRSEEDIYLHIVDRGHHWPPGTAFRAARIMSLFAVFSVLILDIYRHCEIGPATLGERPRREIEEALVILDRSIKQVLVPRLSDYRFRKCPSGFGLQVSFTCNKHTWQPP